MSEAVSLAPIPAPQRNDAIDVLRGVAVLGIFMVNALLFGLPLVDVMLPPAPGALTPIELRWWTLVKVCFEFKFITIFSVLFGAGMIVQMQRAEAAGRPFAPVYVRRLATLALIGLVHGLFLWYGDILFHYACIGMIVFFLRNLAPKTMLLIAAISLALALAIPAFFGLIGAAAALMEADAVEEPVPEAAPAATVDAGVAAEVATAPVVSDDPWRAWVDAVKRVGENPEDPANWREVEVLAYRDGPWGAALIVRSVTFVTINLSLALGGLGFRTGALFLLGAALMKIGFFEGRWRRWHWMMVVAGLPAGVGLEILGAWLQLQLGAGRPIGLAAADTVHQLGSLTLAAGYTGTVLVLASGGAGRVILRPLAAVGRMAFTCYLLETLVATAIMYWWGLGRFGSMSRGELAGKVAMTSAGLIVFSMLWLSVFRIGPAEWLWRSATYWRLQPLRR